MIVFISGFDYFKNLLKNHNTKVICSIWDNIGLKEIKNAYKPEICSTHNQNDFQKNFEDRFKNFEKYRDLKRKKWFSNLNSKMDLLYQPLDMLVNYLSDKKYVDPLKNI